MKLDRFMNVARWNFAINRSQYMKMALSLVLVMSLPLLLFILKSIWVMSITHNVEYAIASIPGTDLGTWMSITFILAMPIICGYTFHNLLTKQSRIKELTLPASNGEKFLFHALATIGGALLTYVIGFLLIDILQYIYVGAVYGFSNANWVAYRPILFYDSSDFDSSFPVAAIWTYVLADFGFLAFISTFVLGNAIKYRHNVLWTILFHWCFGFALMIVLGLCAPILADSLRNDLSWLNNLDPERALKFFEWGMLTFQILVIAFCWWMSYRLYCRAQITSKRNK